MSVDRLIKVRVDFVLVMSRRQSMSDESVAIVAASDIMLRPTSNAIGSTLMIDIHLSSAGCLRSES